MALIQLQPFTTTLTAQGGVAGLLTMSSTVGISRNSVLNISVPAPGSGGWTVQVVQVIDGTKVVARLINEIVFNPNNLSVIPNGASVILQAQWVQDVYQADVPIDSERAIYYSSDLVTNWTAPAISGTAPYAFTQYLFRDGKVGLAGWIQSSVGTITAGTTLCTLNPPYRPNRQTAISVTTSNNSIAALVILDTGVVTLSRAITFGGEHLRVGTALFLKNN